MFFSAAHAATDAPTLAREALATEERAAVVVACTALGPARDALRALPAPRGVVDAVKRQAGPLAAALSSPHAEANGLDLGGPVVAVMALDEDVGTLQFPFAGTPEQAEAFARSIGLDVVREGAGWVTRGGLPRRITLEGGRLVVRATSAGAAEVPARAEAHAKLAAALDRLPAAPGCVLVGHRVDADRGPLTLGAALPFDGAAPFTVRIDVPSLPSPALLASGGGMPLLPALPRPPDFVGGVSVPIDRVLEFALHDLRITPPSLEQLRDVVWFPAGLYVAGYLQGDTKAALFALPVASPSGKPLPAGKIMRLVRTLDEAFLSATGKDSFTIQVGDTALPGRARTGFVLAATAPELLDGLGADTSAWLSEEEQAWSQRWPVFLQSTAAGGPPGRVGLRADGAVWELAAELALGPEAAPDRAAAWASLVSGLGAANTQKRLKTQRAEAVAFVNTLRIAELANYAQYDAYEALESAPRPATAVDRTAVPFTAGPAWSRLGILPAADTACSYRVDLVPTGFEARGVCDLDGDGVPATIVAGTDTPAALVTPDNVY